MKIVNQTSDELVLKEGDASGIIFGTLLLLVGIGLGFYLSSSNSVVIWIALALGIIGLAMIFLSSSITVDINKTNGQLVYQKKRIIGGSLATYNNADILRIETRKEWRMQNTSANRGVSVPQQVLISQSVIIFKNGQELPLDHQKSSSGMQLGVAVVMGGSGAEVAIANQVAQFLGVPFQEIAPPASGINVGLGGSGGIQL